MATYEQYNYTTQQYNTAFEVYSFFKNANWTDNSIFGMLGNMTQESSLDPTIWQNGDTNNITMGLGLVQWTHATKLLNWCKENNLDWEKVTSQCKLIEAELNGTAPAQYVEKDFNISFSEYVTLNYPVSEMAQIFCSNYENAGDPDTGNRIKFAIQWSEILSGTTPDSSVGGASSSSSSEETITIQSDQTLSGIAEQYGVTVQDILNWNSNISNANDIYVGETIVIYPNIGGSTSDSGQNGWKEIDSIWYYYVNGTKETGWYGSNGNWYYFNAQGAMQTGWLELDSKWYYLNTQGAMQTGWQEVTNKWYYLNAQGVMQTGWQEVTNKWYYLNTNGTMQTGWRETSGKWYYLDPNDGGAMATGKLEINDTWYTFSSSGAMESSNSGATTTYTVQSGDTLSSIALKYNVTIAQLQAWNQISNPNQISIGQVLNV